MDKLTHLALSDDGIVVASFMDSMDAQEFCSRKGLCHVPFNPNNVAGAPVPAVGTKYLA